ncbi:MAG: DUF2752 domain-containing protein [Clostridia bacterium]|nr:DUF2752 domain-containing protein [Clostridia bacterium]
MNNQKIRLKKLLILTALILGSGIAYYLFIRFTGFAVPCIIYKSTGLYCITCGITRMFVALFSLDFVAAAKNNILVLTLLAPAIIFAIYKAVKYVKTGQLRLTKPQKIIILLVLLLSIAFMVLRNLPQLSFLAPI